MLLIDYNQINLLCIIYLEYKTIQALIRDST